eukprot:1444196-Alexandrium_andersonii.AAC.1
MQQSPRWLAGRRRRRPDSGSRWPTGCKASHLKLPAKGPPMRAGARRSPLGSSRRPACHAGLRKIGRLQWAGSGRSVSRMTDG